MSCPNETLIGILLYQTRTFADAAVLALLFEELSPSRYLACATHAFTASSVTTANDIQPTSYATRRLEFEVIEASTHKFGIVQLHN